MEWHHQITADPSVLNGKPVIKGTRISVELVLECIGRGWTVEQILSQYPHLTREGVLACIEYSIDLVRSERVTAVQA